MLSVLLGTQQQGAMRDKAFAGLQTFKNDCPVLEAQAYFNRTLAVVIITDIHVYPVGFVLGK